MPDDYKSILGRMHAMAAERGLVMEPHQNLAHRLFNGSGELPGYVGSLDYVVDGGGSHGQITVMQSLDLGLRGTKGRIVNRIINSGEPLTVEDALGSRLYFRPGKLLVVYEEDNAGDNDLYMEIIGNGKIKPGPPHAKLFRGKSYEEAFTVMLDLVQGKQQLPK